MKEIQTLPFDALKERGFEPLDECNPDGSRKPESHVDWLRGLGVPLLYQEVQGKQANLNGGPRVWGPPWVNVLQRGLTPGVLLHALPRCARDPVWRDALLAAWALGGKRAAHALVRGDEG